MRFKLRTNGAESTVHEKTALLLANRGAPQIEGEASFEQKKTWYRCTP